MNQALPSFALEIRGLAKNFGQPAVDGLDLRVRTGEFYTLLGPNGAGKTTTLRMVAGLLKPDRGSIAVFGIDALADPIGVKKVVAWLSDEPMNRVDAYRMVGRRTAEAGFKIKLGCHTFWATGITAYLAAGGPLERACDGCTRKPAHDQALRPHRRRDHARRGGTDHSGRGRENYRPTLWQSEGPPGL